MAMLNVWRIPLLFMISGMGARYAMERRDWKQFLADRGLRIAVPFVFGFFFICPITDYVLSSYYSLDIGYHPNAGHLWFLMNILCYIAYTIGIPWTLKTYPDNVVLRFISGLIRRPWMIYVGAIPLMLEAWLMNPQYFANFPTPHGHFAGATCFAAGILFASLGYNFWKAVHRLRWCSAVVASGSSR